MSISPWIVLSQADPNKKSCEFVREALSFLWNWITPDATIEDVCCVLLNMKKENGAVFLGKNNKMLGFVMFAIQSHFL